MPEHTSQPHQQADKNRREQEPNAPERRGQAGQPDQQKSDRPEQTKAGARPPHQDRPKDEEE